MTERFARPSYWTVGKVKVCLREYWPVVDQEDTVLSGVTLNFMDCFINKKKSQ